jgi:hypothetical protein
MLAMRRGNISSIQTYGAFVRLEGLKRQGLVHISQYVVHLTAGRGGLRTSHAITQSLIV